jgi:preprotein translocase subunit SecG
VSAFITIIHVVICMILIVAVLLQSGKAADLAGAFGGVGSQTAFGPRGTATILSKVTTISAILFMVTSLGLWMLSFKGEKSVVKGEPAAQTTTAPGTKQEEPAAAPAQKPGEDQTAPQSSTPNQAPGTPAAKPEPKKTEPPPQTKPN